MNKEQFDKLKVDRIAYSRVYCAQCSSKDLTIEFPPTGTPTLNCLDCGIKTTINSKEELNSLYERAGLINMMDDFKPKSIMRATVCYDSVASASSPMTLRMLYDAVTEAMEKGMPMESEVFNSLSEAPIEGVRFLFETDRVSPIECGNHMYGDQVNDLLIDTHECGYNND